MNEIYIYYGALGLCVFIICALVIFIINLRQKQGRILSAFETLNSQKNELENANIEQRVRLENETARVEELREQTQNLTAKTQRQSNQNDALEGEISELKAKISELSATLNEREKAHERLGKNLERLSAQNDALEEQISALKAQNLALQTTLSEREKSQKIQDENFALVKQNLSAEFENLANKIFDEKSLNFTKNSQISLEMTLNPLKEQIVNFQKRTNEIHDKTQQDSINLQNAIKNVLDIGLGMSREAQNLTSALKGNNKIAGNWGEVQLETTLQSAGLVAGEHYEAQHSFASEEGRRLVPDFIVRLPDGKHVVIDSKVSLAAYDEAVAASAQGDEVGASGALARHAKSVRTHIDELAKKDYGSLGDGASPDFVLMFMPVEPAYIEAMKRDAGLFGYGYERKVVMVSHTTLMPILRTIANLWRIDRGNKEATQIVAQAVDIYNNLCGALERMKRLGNALNTASASYNETLVSLTGRQGLLGKVEKFKQLSNKANQNTPELSEISANLELNRLENLDKNS